MAKCEPCCSIPLNPITRWAWQTVFVCRCGREPTVGFCREGGRIDETQQREFTPIHDESTTGMVGPRKSRSELRVFWVNHDAIA
ncbi:hypothetical protein C452_13940 [Haloferax volcanii JCM 10717]|uniref:Uncharacterized protein n=2 Tax=Haloferax volcanii TaxID=2246 RepID=M0HTE9_HALVO|nr:hypothetical protein C456_06892 [Haloferax lucentense DSM 14919]ELZ87885.1 hypothetical protein C452_13940 [Haloferax alexandrinus JCM 10717]